MEPLEEKQEVAVVQTYDFSTVKAIREHLRDVLSESDQKKFFALDKVNEANLKFIVLRSLTKTSDIEKFAALMQETFDERISIISVPSNLNYKLDITKEHNMLIEKKLADELEPEQKEVNEVAEVSILEESNLEITEAVIQPEIVEDTIVVLPPIDELVIIPQPIAQANQYTQKGLSRILKGLTQEISFEFTVPLDFDSSEYLGKMLAEKGIFADINPGFTAENFKLSSARLKPGERYVANFFRVDVPIYIDECMLFHATHHSIFIGGPGLALLASMKKELFPEGTTFSFDKEMYLWTDEDGHKRVPGIHKRGYRYDIRLGYFAHGCFPGDYILSVVPFTP